MAISKHGTPQSTYPGNAQTSVVVTVGDLIVVGYSYQNTNQNPTVSDNAAGGTNTYTKPSGAEIGNSGGSTTCFGHQFWAIAKASETLTITATAETDNGIHVSIYTSTNGFPASPVDGTAGTSSDAAAGTSHTSGNTTPASGDSVVVVCNWFEETANAVLTENGTGFTKESNQDTHVSDLFDKIITSATGSAVNNAVTSDANTFFNSVIVAYKENAGAAAGNIAWVKA